MHYEEAFNTGCPILPRSLRKGGIARLFAHFSITHRKWVPLVSILRPGIARIIDACPILPRFLWKGGIARIIALSLLCATLAAAQNAAPRRTYVGFDRDDYPSDAALSALRKDFRFTGYWLNNPPGFEHNTWTGKRALLKRHGFGFLVLFNGRLYAELKSTDPAALGTADGKAAAAAALREGFARNTLIFLDQEEGGGLLPEQAAYIFAWASAVRAAGARAGVYCSAIDVKSGEAAISTARDIVQRETVQPDRAQPHIKLWIANDQCPPAPGCTLAAPPLAAALTPELAPSTLVWQYAQSPRRAQFTAQCPANYAPNGNCYAPATPQSADTFVDLDVSASPSPSEQP